MRLQLDLGAARILTLNFVEDDPLVADVFDEALNQMRNLMIEIARGKWTEETVDRNFRFGELHFRFQYTVDEQTYILTEQSKKERASDHKIVDGMILSLRSDSLSRRSPSKRPHHRD